MDIHLKVEELIRNHSLFNSEVRIKKSLKDERKRLELLSPLAGKIHCCRDLITVKNKNYLWLQLSYDEDSSIVPESIMKYFKGSKNRNDYRMNGDSELEIYQFPKQDFPSFSDIVRQFETEYLIYAPKINKDSEIINELHKCLYIFNEDYEITVKIEDMYDNSLIFFSGFEDLFYVKEDTYDIFDFVPMKSGYKDGKHVRLRCLINTNGNEHEALYETDKSWIFISAGTS